MPAKTPVLIRGVLYESQVQAEKALGVGKGAVYSALDRGTIDHVGFGRNWNNKCAIVIDGVKYESRLAAERAHGFPYAALTSAVQRARQKGRKRFKYHGHDVVILKVKGQDDD